ncbi:MAG: phosphoribosylformylglycinamidine synthase [Chromatiales bacterium]|nr:phosphoribosylformylglycinamidine synthase [Chromatiales bacterium]
MPLFHSCKPQLEKQQHLLKRLQAIASAIVDVEIAVLYFPILKSAPDTSLQQISGGYESINIEKFYKLLDIDAAYGGKGPPWRPAKDTLLFYVVPRQWTISSWSSKATDIFNICDMDIARVERGFCYRLVLDRLRAVENATLSDSDAIKAQLHDRMTEEIYSTPKDVYGWLDIQKENEPGKHSIKALATWTPPDKQNDASPNKTLVPPEEISKFTEVYGKECGLSNNQIAWLEEYYLTANRRPTTAEVMMYAQVNSEHCRHKLFNAHWRLDTKRQEQTLFDMIKSTRTPADRVELAYKDNASIIKGAPVHYFHIDPSSRCYRYKKDSEQHFLIKVETHNHPTAISPFPGAATGSGGEIRDESATGRGGRPRMGLVGFSLSNLCIPDFEQPWEQPPEYPTRIADALQIITEGPLGAARFNNEFGRPCVCGYFRTYEQTDENHHWGYHKPIMIAGGLGSILAKDMHKQRFVATTPLVVFGGPSMRIGLGGGSASSVSSGSSSHELDFSSVQRDNAEMQRRCQEVIEQCTARDNNPILSIHDVGAGGLANALPELVHDVGLGARINMQAIPCADNSLDAMSIWCNESQERYVAAIARDKLDEFEKICVRERCPMAVVGEATEDRTLLLENDFASSPEIEIPMSVLFAEPSDDTRALTKVAYCNDGAGNLSGIDIAEAVERVLKMPAVAAKSFLITIGDRSVTGLICRDQMVGPWQVPVADVAVSVSDYISNAGQAMAIGERTPVATLNPSASGRLAVIEAILNIAASDIANLQDICLSANWMAAAALNEQRFALYQTVQAATDLCKALNIAIPVGKDSLSMQTKWQSAGHNREVISPLSLIVSAFAPVAQVQKTLTPQLDTTSSERRIYFIDLSDGGNRLGGSCLMQAYQRKSAPPDVDNPQRIINFFELMRALRADDNVLAYHDRSDGGMLVALIEMAFAGHCGVTCEVDDAGELIPTLFSEAPGVLLQLTESGVKQINQLIAKYKDTLRIKEIGQLSDVLKFKIKHKDKLWEWDLMQLKRWWHETSSRIQALRDDQQCAAEEMEYVCDENNPGLKAQWDFELPKDFNAELTTQYNIKSTKPKVAILREQGSNGHMEMAAAYERAGFAVYDVFMNDLICGQTDLSSYQGLVACGGFSYGDVLGAGAGWAHSILMHERTREMFVTFFNRDDTFTLGVCNGCQMLSHIKEIIPDASHWPTFVGNRSKQFEARLVKVEITPSPSVLFKEMDGAKLPIIVAHGEGKAVFSDEGAQKEATDYTCLRYIDNYDQPTELYPANPNGSPQGANAFCSKDGRATILMPHPERLYKTTQYSWHARDWGAVAPWFKLFQNAYRFCQ